MVRLSSVLCAVTCLQFAFHTVQSIKCRKCFPPMPEDDCKRSDAIIDCLPFEPLGYDSCIQVEYRGNNTMSRTCYRSFMCEEAREWCKRRGPCTVKCCGENLCNGSNIAKTELFLVSMVVSFAIGLKHLL